MTCAQYEHAGLVEIWQIIETALLAADRATVDAVHALALQHGGRCEGPPGLRPEYHASYYGAYFRDPEGNKLCVCCHGDA